MSNGVTNDVNYFKHTKIDKKNQYVLSNDTYCTDAYYTVFECSYENIFMLYSIIGRCAFISA
jgi:hypothetical protein